MDEYEFQRILNLFPVVRSSDYQADSVSVSSSQSATQLAKNEEWQDASDGTDKKEIRILESEHDAFWGKLKMAAEKKVGATEAERFCRAFKRIHSKLVYEELSLDAARRLLSSSKSSEEE
ncbi:hypothetical protein NMG60_11021127 [Bertholletia excelsa]